MKKFKHLLSLFLVLALTITCVPNIGVYAQAEGTESTTTQNLPLDKSYRIKTTEGVASNNGYALGMTAPKYGGSTSSYVEEIEEGGFFRIEALKGKVYIETYSADYKLLSTKKLSMNCLNLEDILKVKMHGISCLDRITMNRIIQKKLSGLSNMMMTGINLDSAV